MKTTLRARRILLDQLAVEHLQKMMATLSEEGSHLSLIPSKAVSWIVSDFALRSFVKEKQRMMDGLFNRRSFLREMVGGLKDGSDDEIQRIETTLRSLRQRRSVKASDRPRKEVQPEPSVGGLEAKD